MREMSILGLDIGLTTGWCIIDEDGTFREWGEHPSIWSIASPEYEDFTASPNFFRLVIAEVPVIVGYSILGKKLDEEIRYFESRFPGMVKIGSGVWKTSNVRSIPLPDRKHSPHMRDAFGVAQYGRLRYCVENQSSPKTE